MAENYRCSLCGSTEVSPYYFRTPNMCNSCFDKQPAEAKARVNLEYPKPLWEQDAERPSPAMAKQWQRMQEIGRGKFIWVYGAAGVGGLPGLLFFIRYQSVYGPLQLAARLLAFPALGIAWAVVTWEIYRRKCEPGTGRARTGAAQPARAADSPRMVTLG